MSDGAPTAPELTRALRHTRWSVLGTLAACAAALLLLETEARAAPAAGLTDPWTLLGIGLALGSILARRAASAPHAAPRGRVRLTLLAWGLAGALGVAGVAAGLARGEPRHGLLFVLAGAIFCAAARPPSLGAGSAGARRG